MRLSTCAVNFFFLRRLVNYLISLTFCGAPDFGEANYSKARRGKASCFVTAPHPPRRKGRDHGSRTRALRTMPSGSIRTTRSVCASGSPIAAAAA
jgi:hypothetical protein